MRLRDPLAIIEETELEIVLFGYDINGNVVHESSGFEGIEFSILDSSIASVRTCLRYNACRYQQLYERF